MEVNSSMEVTRNGSGKVIHCKVACDGQFRRFMFDGTEFAALKRQVGVLLGLPAERQFVLKYEDGEGDLITLESNEELACATRYGKDPNLLRLRVVFKDDTEKKEKTVEKVVECEFSDEGEEGHCKKWKKCKRGSWEKHGHPYGRGMHGRGRGRGRHGHGEGEREGCGKWKDDQGWKERRDKKCLMRLRKKKERLEETLNFLEKIPQEEGNPQLRAKRINHVKEKIAIVDLKLNTLQQGGSRHPRDLTDDERKQTYLLRERITTIKYIIQETKAQLKQKERSLKEIETSHARTACEAELAEMKATIWDLKKQVRDLKGQMFVIYHSSSPASPTAAAVSTKDMII